MKVDIEEFPMYGGGWHYRMMVGGKLHSSFSSETPLTYSQQREVVAGYEEGLSIIAERDRMET